MTKRSPEYWKSRTYDVGYYASLFVGCLLRFQLPSGVMKANFGLPYGGSALASKFEIQEVIGQGKFAPTAFIDHQKSWKEKKKTIVDFAQKHGYPVVLKPDNGFVGKGIFKIDSVAAVDQTQKALGVDYLVQDFVPGAIEFGVFFARLNGVISVPSINQKFFPTVIGDGKSTIVQLAKKDERYSNLWVGFLRHHDTNEILPSGEKKVISFLGSNTLGSKFTEATNLVNPAIITRMESLFSDVPGYNFGRLDVKAASIESFLAGHFVVIEANGIMSQPTNMLDPNLSLWGAIKIWHRHSLCLLKIAREHRKEPMETLSLLRFIRQSKTLIDQVERQHEFTQKH